MADLGFTELSMEPVVCAPDDPAALTEEDLEIVKEQYEILAKDMLRREKEGKPITFYHYMLDLTGGPCMYKRISGCGSGTEYMAVTPWGDLYPCHQFVGEEKYKLGDIWQGVTNTALREEFRSCNAYARPECDDCWARLYCSGGCAANAYHATGSIRGIYEPGCELFRKRIECAIMMKIAEEDAQENENADRVILCGAMQESGMVRFHMPGHKGAGFLGCEGFDITEISGADELYEAEGIIAESERNAAVPVRLQTHLLFHRGFQSVHPRHAAAGDAAANWRYAADSGGAERPQGFRLRERRCWALEVRWLWPEKPNSLLCLPHFARSAGKRAGSACLSPLAGRVRHQPRTTWAAWRMCRALRRSATGHGTLLLVDNAHGAYLHFLEKPLHPMDLGADLCCDSAHKTLPVLTGGAYLHLSRAHLRRAVRRSPAGAGAVRLHQPVLPDPVLAGSVQRAIWPGRSVGNWRNGRLCWLRPVRPCGKTVGRWKKATPFG